MTPSRSPRGETDSELPGFRSAIKGFEAANDGVRVTLNSVPYEQMFTNIDAQLQSNTAPDIFRVPYYTFGSYAGAGQLLDLGPLLGNDTADRFTPQAWAAVQNDDSPYGVPHHTDTSVILYNKEMLDEAGITSVPTSLDQAWTWAELEEVAQQLRDSLPADKYPFAYNWQGNGVTRWLSWRHHGVRADQRRPDGAAVLGLPALLRPRFRPQRHPLIR